MPLFPPAFICVAPYVIDGDTIQCSRGPRVRIARIDAPEMPGHCRRGRNCAPGDPFEAKAALVEVIDRHDLQCTAESASARGGSAIDRYGRTVAKCSVNGVDLGEYMIAGGFAVAWPHQ
jgi:endonuclease YncB( thermonuclease family)